MSGYATGGKVAGGSQLIGDRGGCVISPATVARVSPNPKRVLDPEDETAIREALTAARHAEQAVRDAVLTAAQHGASVRSLAEFTGMSTNTIHRWKMEARQQS